MGGAWLFLAAYACSGFAGLIYEVGWTRLATLYLGHTTAAASTVVAAFMGGLAGGSAVGGLIARRLKPKTALLTYASLELLVIVAALLVSWGLKAVVPLLRAAYDDGNPGVVFASARLGICLILFTIPALAIGATFPMAIRWFVTRAQAVGRLAGALYAANTLGAALGAVAAGFLLLPSIGVFRTVLVGIASSMIAAVIGVGLWARAKERLDDPVLQSEQQRTQAARGNERKRARPVAAQKPSHEQSQRKIRLAAILLALSGFATLTFEIAWTRVFALTAGPSTYAFAAIVAIVIAGVGIGATAGSILATRVRSVSLVLGAVLIASGLATAWAAWFAGSTLPRDFAEALASAPASFISLQWQRTWMVVGVIGPAALGLGVAFPLALQLASGDDQEPAARIGLIYALNTGCAVAASLVTGFISIPLLGLQSTLAVVTALLALGAMVLAVLGSLSTSARASIALSAVLLLVWLPLQPQWDRELIASGVYKYAQAVSGGPDLETALKAGRLVYYRDGAAATVSVKQLAGTLSLSVDGKVDASDGGDMLTQKALAHLPMLLHNNPRRICIIGLGSGITLASALVHSAGHVDVVEISPQVVEASQLFAEANHHALDDQRTHLILGDGRTHLTLSTEQYDVIVSEPSNPWMAGVAALFTREFLTSVRARLAPGGILCQWAHTYNIGDADLRSIVATFASVFPNGTMWLIGDGDLLLVGSNESGPLTLDNVRANWSRPNVADDLRAAAAYEPFALLSAYVAGPAEMQRYAGGADIQSDDRMALEFSAPRRLYSNDRENVTVVRGLLDPFHAPPEVAAAWKNATASDRRHRGDMMLKADAYDTAYQDYAAALELDPADPDAPDGLVRSAVAAHREADALARLGAAARTPRTAVHVWIALSKLQAAGGALDRAIAAAKEAIRVEPPEPAAYEQLASLYSDAGDAAGLDTAADTLRQLFPNSRGAHYYTAASQFLHQDLAAAGRTVQQAIAADPKFAPARNLAGAIQASEGNVDAARTAFREALTLDPRDPATYTNFALLELAHGHPSEASELFAEALSIDPASPSARQGLIEAKRALGEK